MHSTQTSETMLPPETVGEEGRAQPGTEEATSKSEEWIGNSPKVLLQGLAFGIIFGFLLQKGGVAKFDILIGQLLLENFTVVKVMLSAIIVGMVGVHLLNRAGLIDYQIKETRLGANIIGGLIFGAGFGLLAYCPGTDAAAVGQGNYDALIGILGMVVGSYLFALSSRSLSRTFSDWGNFGALTLAQMARLPRGPFIVLFALFLIAVLAFIQLNLT